MGLLVDATDNPKLKTVSVRLAVVFTVPTFACKTANFFIA